MVVIPIGYRVVCGPGAMHGHDATGYSKPAVRALLYDNNIMVLPTLTTDQESWLVLTAQVDTEGG